MGAHENFVLSVTAGPSYDESTHTPVAVNTDQPVSYSNEHVDASVRVRIQNYRGLPSHSPSTSPYFTHHSHTSDLYSIQFHFRPKYASIAGSDLVFGNDFDRPIRDRLPPGFGTAFKFVRWMVDPGLEGDPYADQPWLYGPLLSSINVLKVGEKKEGSVDTEDKVKGEMTGKEGEVEVLEEGATSEDGWEVREQGDVPADAAARKKFFLDEKRKKEWVFEQGREYQCDFFNPFLDFNEFAVKLPVITLPILKVWNGESLRKRGHTLRYVLKDRKTSTTLLVVVFKLLPVENLTEPANVATPTTKAKKEDKIDQQEHSTTTSTTEADGTGDSTGPSNDDDDVD